MVIKKKKNSFSAPITTTLFSGAKKMLAMTGKGVGVGGLGPTVTVISKTGLLDGERRHLGMEGQHRPTLTTRGSDTDTGRPVLALYPSNF